MSVNSLENLFANNRAWVSSVLADDPEFFEKLKHQQSPEYLWIGCSDSRVPANQIIGLPPGEIFVHRNVANVVVHTDLNCLSVLHFAVDILKVKHVILCGHYGCSGIAAALDGARLGLSDNWLQHVRDTVEHHRASLDQLVDRESKLRKLCELHVAEQIVNLARTTVVRDAWTRGQPLSLHGWVYGIEDGHLRSLGVELDGSEDVAMKMRTAFAAIEMRDGEGITA
jgi:carbonic anhydrase